MAKKNVYFILSLVFVALMVPEFKQIVHSGAVIGFAPVLLVVLFALSFAMGVIGAIMLLTKQIGPSMLLIAGIAGAAAAILTAYLSFDVSITFILTAVGAAGLIVTSRLSKDV